MKRAALPSIVAFACFTELAFGVDPPANLRVVAVDGGTAPVLTAQPQNQTVIAGQSATFTMAAVGDAPLSYQWTFNGLNVGSSSSSYTRSNCQLADNAGRVQVTVSNGSGSVQSSTATLTVNPAGTNYYVATNGSSGNTGLSTNSPWPLSYALSHAGPSNIITFLPGTYPSIYLTTPSIHAGLTLKSQIKWSAKIVGSPDLHGISAQDRGISNLVVDGFEVDHSYRDGVKLLGPNSTVRNCWIHHSGRGDPNAVTNTDFSYSGQGISMFGGYGGVIENNLIEYNGMTLRHDHGIYIWGTNHIIRGNVLRHNLTWGMQLYDDVRECQNIKVYNNLIYGNRAGLAAYSYAGYTNYVFNNTIISATNFCVNSCYGHLILTNNILAAFNESYPIIESEYGSVVETDYNLVNKSAEAPYPGGAHDVVANDPGFVNAVKGLFWLTSTSPARGMASSSVILPVDFFGNAGSTLQDVGAFQYSAALAGDTRVLDPCPPNSDYWSPP